MPGGHGASKGVARVPALLSDGVVSAVRALPSKVLAPTTSGGKTSTTGKRRKSRPAPPRPCASVKSAPALPATSFGEGANYVSHK